MTELKTLKDLNVRHKALKKEGSFYWHKFPLHEEMNFCWTEQLKKEAIKDIKELIKTKGFLEIFDCEVEPLIEYIKWKFNITEEDLKGGNEKNGYEKNKV